MKVAVPIAVASRSFSKHSQLRSRLLESFSQVRFNDAGASLSGEALVEFLKGAQGAVIALETIDDSVLSRLPELKILAKYGVGLNNLDLEAMKRRGVELGWTGGVNARSVAELTLTFMIGLLREVFSTGYLLKGGEWRTSGGVQLSGKTVGVIGCGHIGQDLIRLLQPFGCRVLVHDLLDKREFCSKHGASQVDPERLLRESDVVTVHVPYEPSTHHLIGARQLATMKPQAILVNTSRGGVVDEAALLEALNRGALGAAGADVFVTEPAVADPLCKHSRFFGTPHIGGSSQEAILAMGNSAIDHLVRYFSSPKV